MENFKKKFIGSLAAGFFGASLISSAPTVFAAPAWKLPKAGIILNNAEKQKYTVQKMEKFIYPETSAEKIEEFSVPDGWKYEIFDLGGFNVERLQNPKAKKNSRVVFQIHGGGYIGPMSDPYRDLAVKQAVLTDAREVYMIDYRIAPENIYPAALEDAAKTYAYLLKKFDAKNLIVIGDSAGGNLALELSIYLRENNLPQPAVMILNSPWTTFENNFPSRKYNAGRDKVLSKENPLTPGVYNSSYAGDIPFSDSRLSPIYADLKGLPPMLIQLGGYEIFLDEGIELMKKAAADGVDVTLTIYPFMSHDFAVIVPELDESVKSFAEMKNFVNAHMPRD